MKPPVYNVMVQGFKASSNMLSNGILGFHFTAHNGHCKLHYRDRFQGKDTSKWIELTFYEYGVLIELLSRVEKDTKNQNSQNKLRGAVVTFIKYVRQFQRERINTEIE